MAPNVSRFTAGARGEVSFIETDECLRLLEVFVAPEHRGQGLGRRLLKRVLRYAAQRSLPVKLRVEPFHYPSMDAGMLIALYGRYGFTRLKGMEMIWRPENTKAI